MKLASAQDVDRQEIVANKLAAAWHCEWGALGDYAPVDVFLMRDKVVMAFAEIKTRPDRTCHQFTTVLINLNKWFSLMQVELGLSLPAFYVVAFTDGVWYVRIGDLPVNQLKIVYRGRTDRPAAHAPHDRSPAIEVPTGAFKRLCDADHVFEEER